MAVRCRHPAVVLFATIVVAAGCSVRDERAVTGRGGDAWWATASGESRAGLIAPPSADASAGLALESVAGFAVGERRAAEAGRPMLVVFGAAWCRWSGDLAAALPRDPAVVPLARQTVCVTVDADREPAVCERFAVRAFPTVILLDGAGQERFRGTGSSALDALPAALAALLAKPAEAPRLADGDHRPRR